MSSQRLPTYFAVDRAGLSGTATVSWLRNASKQDGRDGPSRLSFAPAKPSRGDFGLTLLSLAPAMPPRDESGKLVMDHVRCLDIMVNLVRNRGLPSESRATVSEFSHCARLPTSAQSNECTGGRISDDLVEDGDQAPDLDLPGHEDCKDAKLMPPTTPKEDRTWGRWSARTRKMREEVSTDGRNSDDTVEDGE